MRSRELEIRVGSYTRKHRDYVLAMNGVSYLFFTLPRIGRYPHFEVVFLDIRYMEPFFVYRGIPVKPITS